MADFNQDIAKLFFIPAYFLGIFCIYYFAPVDKWLGYKAYFGWSLLLFVFAWFLITKYEEGGLLNG